MPACIPREPWGTRVRSCHCRSSSMSPCPRHFPRRAPSGDSWVGRRVAGETHVSSVDKQRDTVSRGCWFGAMFVHTPVENRVRVGDCASKYRPGYLGSAALASPLTAAGGVPPRPAPGSTLAQAAELRAGYRGIIKKYKLSISDRNAGSPRLKALCSKAPPSPLLLSLFNGFCLYLASAQELY